MPYHTHFAKLSARFHLCLLAGAVAALILCTGNQARGNDTQHSTAPTIVAQPQNTAAVLGESITLAVEANGTHPLRYRWRQNGQPVPGGTDSTLKLKKACLSTAGEYTVEVSNRHGTNVSFGVKVTVVAPELRAYDQDGIKLRFKARKGIRYTIECNASCSTTSWTVFATVHDKNGTIILSDRAAPSHPMRLFRLRADLSDNDCRDDTDDNDDGDDSDDDDDDDSDDDDHSDDDDDSHRDDSDDDD